MSCNPDLTRGGACFLSKHEASQMLYGLLKTASQGIGLTLYMLKVSQLCRDSPGQAKSSRQLCLIMACLKVQMEIDG